MTSLEISDFTQTLDYVICLISLESYKCNVFMFCSCLLFDPASATV